MYKKIITLGLLAFSLISLCGCSSKQIFATEEDPYALVSLSSSELSDNTYYVKDGAYFYETYFPNGTVEQGSIIEESDSTRIFWTDVDYTLIPTLYSDEILAYPTSDSELTDISIERYSDIGYSVGLYGGYIDDNGYICFNLDDSIVKTSDAYEVFSIAQSDTIQITEINGEEVTSSMLSESGILEGFDEGEDVTITYYAGSYYDTVTIEADEHFYASSNLYTVSSANTTKNGYLEIQMPDEASSGYYLVNGKGFYRYYDCEKGDEESGDLSEADDEESEDSFITNSQQYVISIANQTENISINVTYDTEETEYSDSQIKCVLTSPDGTTYDMTAEDGLISVDLAEAIAGKWTINIYPKDLDITDISAESAAQQQTAASDTYTFTLEEGTYVEFYAIYSGGSVWGTVVGVDGETHKLEEDEDYEDAEQIEAAQEEAEENGSDDYTEYINIDDTSYKIQYTYTYLSAGTYTVTIYHEADATVEDVSYGTDESYESQTIITIEQ